MPSILRIGKYISAYDAEIRSAILRTRPGTAQSAVARSCHFNRGRNLRVTCGVRLRLGYDEANR
jgi:hypothetical protein